MRAHPTSLEILDRLVGFPTVSADSNLDLIAWVEAYLAGLGIASQRLPNPSGDKANLWATIGPAVDGGVVLAGHTDVVPVEGQAWTSDPFTLTVREGRAFGRGTCDMKGFIACALAAAHRFVEAPLSRPVHLAFTYDEEIGCLGAPHLINWALAQGHKPSAVIVGEPTSMGVVNAHKGIMVCRTEIHGHEAHSSLSHLGVSAVALAARAIGLLGDIEAEAASRVTDPRFEPSRSSISVNRIEGGTATNILAGRCAFWWDARTVPGVSARDLLQSFETRLEAEILAPARALHDQVGYELTQRSATPGLVPEIDGEAERLATGLLGANAARAVAYAAEAGQFQEAGWSAVIVGPGSIDQAHTADEYVDLDQLDQCDRFLERLGRALS